MIFTKRSRAIQECIESIVGDPPMAWMLLRPSIGHVATELQKRLKQYRGIDISFEEACRRIRNYQKGTQ